ncbi:MAG: NAD(P) transhydrogenase subunit alpha [Planctomycetota bacterium]
MLLFAPRQNDPAETRTPLTPAVVKKLVASGLHVTLEPELGRGSLVSDQDFIDAGATLAGEDHRAWEDADIVVTLNPPANDGVSRMKEGAVLLGMLAPTVEHELVRTALQKRVSMLSLEFVPRISRAQAMDVLSSQASLGGYKAVLLGASHCPKLLPMMITAAGTLAPARVFVIGVGVAGLQAIATAKRLGAVVEAYDVRPATKDQVLSLGARFVELAGAGGGETSGGYAKEQTEEERKQQAELMAKHVTGADVVITTAAVFGKAPPRLIPTHVVGDMKPGAVVVDLAASADHGGGNCELTRPGETFTTDGGVTIIGTTNLPATLPVHASTALANNVYSLLQTLIAPAEPPTDGNGDGETDAQEPAGPSLALDLDDEIHMGALITHAGEIVDDLVKSILEPGSVEKPEAEAADIPPDENAE